MTPLSKDERERLARGRELCVEIICGSRQPSADLARGLAIYLQLVIEILLRGHEAPDAPE